MILSQGVGMNLEQMNWELAIAYLDDCIKALHECIEKLDKAGDNIKEFKGYVVKGEGGYDRTNQTAD